MIASMTAWGSQAEKLKAKRRFFGLKKSEIFACE
jgi:hypothetical protein